MSGRETALDFVVLHLSLFSPPLSLSLFLGRLRCHCDHKIDMFSAAFFSPTALTV